MPQAIDRDDDRRVGPPHSPEAEQAVLGSLLIDNAAWPNLGGLQASDFFIERHREIFSALSSMLGNGVRQVADVITVHEKLQRAGKAEAVGGMVYLHNLSSSVLSSAQLPTYAKIVREHAERRRLIALSKGAQESAQSGRDAQQIADDLIDRLRQVLTPAAPVVLWAVPAAASESEIADARLSPRCIVEDYIYADVAALIAPGSTGKTTMSLHEFVCITLGIPVWGQRVFNPGPVLLITAEDRREFLVARLREIIRAMRLSAEDANHVRMMLRIDDQTTSRKRLTRIDGDVVVPTDFADLIVSGCRAENFAPVIVQFDPMVSFGVGEQRVNDAEQGLIDAGRIITSGLDCCTRFVAHTGKQVARDKITDQYASRGGSALADGCRMVHVMHALDDAEVNKATGEHLDDKQSAFALDRPKISYGPPQRSPIYVRRTGYAFEVLRSLAGRQEDQIQRDLGEQVGRFIESEFREGRRHSKSSLVSMRPKSLSQADVRTGLAWLVASGLLLTEQVVGDRGKSAKGIREYLRAPNFA